MTQFPLTTLRTHPPLSALLKEQQSPENRETDVMASHELGLASDNSKFSTWVSMPWPCTTVMEQTTRTNKTRKILDEQAILATVLLDDVRRMLHCQQGGIAMTVRNWMQQQIIFRMRCNTHNRVRMMSKMESFHVESSWPTGAGRNDRSWH